MYLSTNFQISYVVPQDAIPGRLALLLTLFLCNVNILNSVSRTSPRSGGNPSAIMLWMVSCILFITIAIMEYSYILWRTNKKKTGEVKDIRNNWKREIQPQRLDNIMLVISPTLFFTFSVIFWFCLVQ